MSVRTRAKRLALIALLPAPRSSVQSVMQIEQTAMDACLKTFLASRSGQGPQSHRTEELRIRATSDRAFGSVQDRSGRHRSRERQAAGPIVCHADNSGTIVALNGQPDIRGRIDRAGDSR